MTQRLKHRISALFLLVMTVSCADYANDEIVSTCPPEGVIVNPLYSRAATVNLRLQELVSNQIPGAVVAIYSSEGWWTSAAGLASIEKKTTMQTCYLQYLQSISKTYMAVVILKLHEQNRLDLDAPVTTYLPAHISNAITDASKISVRMLLNHTSGIPEYNSAPAYVSYLLQHPDYVFNPEQYLKYISKKPLNFTPGSKYSYTNTNYLLLAFIADAITGDHARYMNENIFKPLGLTQTFYRDDSNYLNYPSLVNSYWDRYGNGIVENVSLLQKNNVRSLIGDDGIVATPVDAVKFLRGLMEGQLISPGSLSLMMTWVNDNTGKPTYGLGLDHDTFIGHAGYGHSGGGIGAGCQLYYFPEKNIYIFIGINLGTVTESPIHKKAEDILNQLYKTILE